MVTITDIARRLGVAISTVSKALNGANDVSESTKALILKTAVEMGYADRKIQKSGVRKVCVFVEREEFLFDNQLEYDLAMGFRTAAVQNGWQADTASYQDLLASQETFDTFLLRHNYAGAFLIRRHSDSSPKPNLQHNSRPNLGSNSGSNLGANSGPNFGPNEPDSFFTANYTANYLKNLINVAFPFVMMEAELKNPCGGSIGSDHKMGIFMALEHLCQLGHQKIALLNDSPDSSLSRLREAAYREALEALQLRYQKVLFVSDREKDSIRPLVKQFLDSGVTAVLCSGSVIATAVLACLKELGYRVPEKISVVGFDDQSGAIGREEPFTAVRQNGLALGKAAFYMLEGLRNKIPMGRLLLRPELVLQGTTGPCPETF